MAISAGMLTILVFSIYILLKIADPTDVAPAFFTVAFFFYTWATISEQVSSYYAPMAIVGLLSIPLGLGMRKKGVKFREGEIVMQPTPSKEGVGKLRVKGTGFILLGVVAGGVLTLAIFAASASRGYSILGYPHFAIAQDQAAFQPAISGTLGLVENRFFLTMYLIIFKFAGILAIFPTAVIFAMYHLSSYADPTTGQTSIELLSVAFGMWLVWNSSYTVAGSTVMDTHHFWHNAVLVARRSFAISIGGT